MNRKSLQEAIADAKTIKETAIANAKVALEEAFSPHLKSMLATRLEEMETEEEETFDEEIIDEADTDTEEFDLDEILREIEMEEEEEFEDITEAKDDDDKEKKDDTKDEKKDDKKDKDEEVKETEEEEVEETPTLEVEDMTEDDLKSFIEDVIQDMVQAGELTLEEPTDELEMEDDDMDLGFEIEDDESMIEPETEDTDELEMELAEAKEAIHHLRSELNEINLLNAKLLYANKIFKAKSLKESQKMKVLESFDKAASVKEAKLVYEMLKETYKTPSYSNKKSITENIIGSASKAIGNRRTIKEAVVDIDPMVARFQKLAGIK